MTVPKNQKPIHVSGAEASILRDYVKTSPLLLTRHKAQTVLLAYGGADLSAISYAMDRKEPTIHEWLSDWRKYRLASVFTGHSNNNNAGKLTPEQREEIRQALQSPPSDFGLPKGFWDVPQLKTYLTAAFGVVYDSLDSYYFLLKFSNLSFKYPDKFDLRRSEAAIAERMIAIRSELAPFLASDDYEVFSADEVRMDQEAITRRAWITKGGKTIIKVNRDRESQSYIGFLNQKTGECETFEMPWQKSSEVLKAYESFLANHPDKRVVVVWDNASFHKSAEIRAALGKGNLLERVHLISMPPYAPDHNPIEHVWKEAKQDISNIQHETFQQTKEAFAGFIQSRKFAYTF
jgi:transposase